MNQSNFQADEPLLAGFTSLEQIRSIPYEKISSHSLLNVIGVLKDQQAPIITRGTDAKYTLEIVDFSTRGETYGLKVNIFWPMDKMPKSARRADVVLIRKIKVQMYNGNISLIANYGTEFHLLSSKDVPSDSSKLKSASWSSYPRTQKGTPNLAETRYGVWLYSNLADLDLPSDTEFEERTRVSMNVKDKFSLLKDLNCDQSSAFFANIIGEVIKIHDSSFDWLSLYISDYTANSKFFKYVWGNGDNNADGMDDEWGYLPKKTTTKKSEWPGPFGKMTLQITVYDSQASYIREHIKTKQWVLLKNVHIKYGRQGNLIEGYLRGDDRICTEKLEASKDSTAEPDTTEGRLQDAIKRKFEWTKKFQQQQRAIQNEDAGSGPKRKRDDPNDTAEPKMLNSKQRRKLEREAAEKKVREAELKRLKLQHLNPNVKCSFPDQDPVTIAKILNPANIELDGHIIQAPFTNTKYRANVRVVDYFPPRLEDFSVGYRSSEFDMLSDYSGEEDSDAETRREIWHSGKGFAKDRWEWRFALQVEDADEVSPSKKDRMWLMVDNQSAQMLLNIPDDASRLAHISTSGHKILTRSSLRTDRQLLTQLREQLFKLWGNLEERKTATLPKLVPPAPTKTQSTQSFLSSPAPASSPPLRTMPSFDGDSDDEADFQESRKIQCAQRSQDSALEERNANIMSKLAENDSGVTKKLEISNKAFMCCIKQYGVKVEELDRAKANAGDGLRWQRVFGLFGTMID